MTLDKRSCISRAQALLANPTPENLRYAALEIRLCIEALTYEKLRSFGNLVPEERLKTWQPPQAVKALLEFSPNVDRSFTIFAGIEEEYGKPAKGMKLIGEHHALPLKWLRKHYNKVGKMLHAPSVLETHSASTSELISYLNVVISDLEAPLSGNISGVSIRDVYSFTCQQCQDTVVCNAEFVRQNNRAICLNHQCKAEYFASVTASDEATFQLMVTTFECSESTCSGVASIENRKLKIGLEFKCDCCGLKHVITDRQWGYGAVEE